MGSMGKGKGLDDDDDDIAMAMAAMAISDDGHRGRKGGRKGKGKFMGKPPDDDDDTWHAFCDFMRDVGKGKGKGKFMGKPPDDEEDDDPPFKGKSKNKGKGYHNPYDPDLDTLHAFFDFVMEYYGDVGKGTGKDKGKP